MSYVTIQDFQKFTNVHQDNTSLQQSYIDSAENIVENYLGYSPVVNAYIDVLKGNGSKELQLKARPIRNIISLEIDRESVNINDIVTKNEFIYYRGGFPDGSLIYIDYIAGFNNNVDNTIDGGDADDILDDTIEGGLSDSNYINEVNIYEMPTIIKLTVLRIAALLQTESDNNIGITSKTFAESGTRTFINTVNFDKYLIQISKYALLRI
jgi:hypothetical protein